MKNKSIFSTLLVLLIGLLAGSCSKSAQPIDYGKDACHFCQMTIVDKIHGAELITDKGKIYKFDAAECLIRYKNDLENIDGYQLLTNHFESPGDFISMEDATFLISEELPSPMGAYLTAFKTKNAAAQLQQEKSGNLYNWKELNEHLKD